MRLHARLYSTVPVITLIALASCHYPESACGPFANWQTSEYVLPYAVGTSHFVSQSNCSTGGHRGPYKYPYDFVMPIGTTVTAARAGVVAEIRMKFRNGQSGEGESNWVKIRHADGTIAAYSHLTESGALVRIGDSVVAGQPVGLSGNTGNTGNTGGLPHLHFHLCACSESVDCGTMPVTFRNADRNPAGLTAKRNYVAHPYARQDVNLSPSG